MNSRQLHYAVLLSQIKNFSQVADRLNITQPALSKQILSLEQELGVRLFDRSTTPLSLTPAGECFIQNAQEILYREEQLKRTMEAFHSGEKGRIIIGIAPFRSLYFISDVILRMKAEYPGIQIVLKEANSTQLHKGIVNGDYDFAIMHLPVDELQLDILPMKPEPLVLAVPDGLLPLLDFAPSDGSTGLPTLRLEDCGRLPFVTVSQQQELRQLFDRLCMNAGIHPEISVEVIGVATAWAMARAGLGATLLPLGFMQDKRFSDGLSVFALQHTATTRQPAVVIRKGQFLSDHTRRMISFLTENSNPPDAT